MTTNILFVYGSLRRGFQNPMFQYLSKHFEFCGDGKVRGKLFDLGEYPAAISSADDTFIIGELYSAKSEDEFNWSISQLDDYEGVYPEEGEQQLYKRELVTVFSTQGEVTAWIYWYNGNVANKPFIESGDVMEYFKMKNG
jgi:gamma-glutamylcyclotransferase (GGCT)/AIG2-like uncharacterized protein YtfP